MLMVVVVVLLVKLFVLFWTKVGELLLVVVLIFVFAVVVSCSLNSISDLIVVFFSVFVVNSVGLLIVVEDNSRLFSVLTIIGVVMWFRIV